MGAGRKLELTIEGRTFEVQVEDLQADRASVLVDGQPVQVAIRAEQPVAPAPAQAPAAAKAPSPTPAPQPAATPSPAPASGDGVRAVMPGVVVRLDVSEGQQVSSGDVLLVLEAMKMENEIRADRDATIGQIHVSVGQKVQTGDLMIGYT